MEHHHDLGKIRVGLVKLILMVGFSGILGTGFINTELKSDSDWDSEEKESKFDAELMEKLESGSGSE